MGTKTLDDLIGETRIDTRDIIEAAQELRDEIEADPRELTDQERELLTFDESGADEITDYPYGEQLIREDDFKEYAQELAEDIGAIDPRASWPMNCIDWEQAARELAMDYTSVTFLGREYLVRP